MRLIDADNMKTIHEIQMANFNSIEGIRAWIDRQPTAYDVEKVVEELKHSIRDYTSDYHGVEYIELEDAIEIVRKGGVE